MAPKDAKAFIDGIKNQDRTVLAQAISLVESKNEKHQKLAKEVLQGIIPLTGKAKRIGISGIPGVGKSTFIENFGMYLIEQKQKVAVLAIDPTSQKTGGSIMGDKTRMHKLSSHKNAFIRPSPSGSTLGGITAKTREALLLCDAFGFDTVLVETVGVGQSEVSVSHITDMFVLLMQPGAGDELQGIKRGILEVSDLVLINKADGENRKLAEISKHDYEKSLDVLQEKRSWKTKVELCSSLEGLGFENILTTIGEFYHEFDSNKRNEQLSFWLEDLLMSKFKQSLSKIDLKENVKNILNGKKDILSAADEIYKEIK